jgi:hypothetical protein
MHKLKKRACVRSLKKLSFWRCATQHVSESQTGFPVRPCMLFGKMSRHQNFIKREHACLAKKVWEKPKARDKSKFGKTF